ncbi:hypothetical protein F5B18DRAFT_641115 [Nemania serpens]|nr:hypothetical protein F5B18DRAFT_641115 [Nemania serpens]
MESLSMPDHSFEDHSNVRSWLKFLPDDFPPIDCYPESDGRIKKPPPKRRRIMEDQCSNNTMSLPNPPPISYTTLMDARRAMIDQSRQRNCRGNLDPKSTPGPQQTTGLTQFPAHPIHPPCARKKNCVNATLQHLETLEKPFLVSSCPQTVDGLPKDVHALYACLLEIDNCIQIIPHKVRQRLEADGVTVFPHFFCKQDTNDGIEFDNILEIVHSATDSAMYYRDDCGWGHHVHGPLLKLVFASKISDFSKQTGQPTVQARFEPAMTATIHGPWIPQYRDTGSQGPVRLPCKVSRDSPNSNSQSGLTENAILSGVHSSSTSKKVDYVIVLDDNGSLQNAITNRIYYCDEKFRQPSPHVNQTLYPAITKSPIAVSIGTKKLSSSTNQDTLVQLGIWVATWHSRLIEELC